MRKSAPIEVVVHYPKTEEGWEELGKRVTTAHANLCDRKNRAAELPYMAEAGTVSGSH